MFKVGDKVRIKSREQMEKEFGLNDYGNIEMGDIVIVRTMKHLCGGTAEIVWVNGKDVGLTNRSNDEEIIGFDYTTDMIELIEENKTEQERKPTPGEYVEVSDGSGLRDKKIYLATLNGKYNCVIDSSKKKFYEGKYYKVAQWNYIRPIQTKQTYMIEATEEQYKKIQELIA